LGEARRFLSRALAARPDEKYFADAVDRVDASQAAYSRLAAMFDAPGMEPRRPAATAPPATRAMGNADVIQLKAIGLPDPNIIAAIQQAPAVGFDLSPQGLKALAAAGVSGEVTAAMRARTR
jgi:hypothetical protein